MPWRKLRPRLNKQLLQEFGTANRFLLDSFPFVRDLVRHELCNCFFWLLLFPGAGWGMLPNRRP
jgi:hypothetical protein